MSNKNAVLNGYRKRWRAAATELEAAKRVAREAFASIKADMKRGGFSKADLAGVKLAARRSGETAAQKAARIEAEQIACALAEFGE
jgi:hypothetical protein